MSDGFSVNLDALNTAASGIVNVLQELESHQVKDIDCESGAFGHDKLAGTTKDFCDRWQKGVKNLAEDGHKIAERLVQTIADYTNTDTGGHNRLNEAATPGGGDSGGSW